MVLQYDYNHNAMEVTLGQLLGSGSLRRAESPRCAVSIASGSPAAVEIASRLGFELLVVDARQAAVSPFSGELESLIRAAGAAGASVIASLPESSPGTVNRALNDGAAGIIAPFVRSAKDAQALVHSSRYPPLGGRGAAPVVRAAGYGTQPWDDYQAETNSERIVLAALEDREALAAAAAIVAVDWLDGIGNARAAGKIGGVSIADADSAGEFAELGCNLIVLESDIAACARQMVDLEHSLRAVPRRLAVGGAR